MKRTLAVPLVVLALSACSEEGVGEVENNCVTDCDASVEDTGPVFGPADPQDWPSFRHGPRRQGKAVGATVGSTVEVAWSQPNFLVRPYTAAKPSGVVWGDTLYYPSDQGTMYAFDRMTGEQRWKLELIDRSPGIHGSPTVTESTVLIGTYGGHLWCLDRASGAEIWKYKIGNVIGSSPVYVHDHRAVYTSHETPKLDDGYPGGGYVTKNDPNTGEELWVSEKLHHWPHSSVGVDPDRKLVVVGANDGILHAYSTDDGQEQWTVDLEPGSENDPGTADIKTTPAFSAKEPLVIFGSWDQHVRAIDVDSGVEAWSHDTGGAMMGSVAIDDDAGRVYAATGGSGPSLWALSLTDGSTQWSATIGPSSSSPAIGDRPGGGQAIVVGTNTGLYALDAETGDQIWHFEADGAVTSSPALVGDMIYFAAKEGSLYALRTAN